ncbi:MAG: GNAT family N-acetyltransferase [Paenibacillaceae bacterium]|nr:GNAT family N-acetyltransferase [Paenibacillaceae bacterium]
MNLTFHKLCTSNIEDAAHVIIEAYKMPPWSIVWSAEQAQKSITVSMNNPQDRCFAAFKDDVFVGILIGRIQIYAEDEFYIMQLAIHPQYSQKGIGRRLLTYCTEQIKSEGITHIELMTAPHDTEFYEKCEFNSSDAINFWKDL